MIKFYDTSSLLLMEEKIFEDIDDKVIISSITLKELELIKTSSNKDEHIKYAARKILHILNENPLRYITHIFHQTDIEENQIFKDFELTNDIKILASAFTYLSNTAEDYYFITNDMALKAIARTIFPKEKVISVNEGLVDDYTGYLELQLNDIEMADFYSNQKDFALAQNILINQYINIYDSKNKRVDTLRWDGKEFKSLKYSTFFSRWLGEIKPFKNDIYQAMVADSLINNKITAVKGPAGTGKSHLSLGFLFYLLQQKKIDKIIIFCNTVATKNSARLGFYPGSKNEKLLDSQIGNFLSSKLGGIIGVEQLIESNQLILLPMSDIRGYDTSGMNAGIYITEAQNLDIDLLKLALQRVGEDSIIILDGDSKSQVDLINYEGSRNGLKRASEVFRGTDIYGEVELKNIHRSQIAKIANLM